MVAPTEECQDAIHIGTSFRIGREPSMPNHGTFTGVVGCSNKLYVAFEIREQPPQVCETAMDVLRRVEGLPHIEARSCFGNELHKPLRVFDGARSRIEVRFCTYNRDG